MTLKCRIHVRVISISNLFLIGNWRLLISSPLMIWKGNIYPSQKIWHLWFVVPSVDGCITLSEPADSWQLLLLASSTKIHNHIVFCHHQIQSSNNVPAEIQTLCHLVHTGLWFYPDLADSPEQVIHHILVIVLTILRQVTGRKHNDVIHAVSIVTWVMKQRFSQVFQMMPTGPAPKSSCH